MSNIFKVNNKDTRKMYGISIVNFEHNLQFIPLLIIAEFEQMLLWPQKQQFQEINLFPVTVRNILSYELGKFVGLCAFIVIHPTSGCEINFHNSTSSQTLHKLKNRQKGCNMKGSRWIRYSNSFNLISAPPLDPNGHAHSMHLTHPNCRDCVTVWCSNVNWCPEQIAVLPPGIIYFSNWKS